MGKPRERKSLKNFIRSRIDELEEQCEKELNDIWHEEQFLETQIRIDELTLLLTTYDHKL